MSDNEVISLLISDIPQYLHSGEFYIALNNEEECIEVPSSTTKMNTIVENDIDLIYLLNSLRFWVVSEIPKELLTYMLSSSSDNSEIIIQFKSDFPYLGIIPQLKNVIEEKRLSLAIQSNNIDLVLGLIHCGYILKESHSCDAASSGNLQMLELCYEILGNIDEFTAHCAAKIGNLSCLIYAVEHGCIIDNMICVYTAITGSIECLKYLLNNEIIISTFLTIILLLK